MEVSDGVSYEGHHNQNASLPLIGSIAVALIAFQEVSEASEHSVIPLGIHHVALSAL